MYLLIQNEQIAPVEAFTVLGLSTARGDSSKIGQFGSGSKHSINILLRSGLTPIIYLGQEELKFFTKPDKMGDKEYSRVYYNFKGETEKTGFSLEFGELDWNNIEMVLREFISNAIDSVGVENTIIDIVEKPMAYDNATSIYIPLTDSIKKYYENISEKFLHFTNKQEQTILNKNDYSTPKIYRKGVFVREIADNTYFKKSLFDYNFGEDIKIDESRNMDDSICLSSASKVLGNDLEGLKEYFSTLTSAETIWEDRFYYWYFKSDIVKEAWQQTYGNKIPCDNPMIGGLVEKKGYDVIHVRNLELLKNIGIKIANDLVTDIENDGCQIREATKLTVKTFNKVWRKLETIGLTNGKEKPEIKSFTSALSNNGKYLFGYYKDGCIYINIDQQGSHQTILEECAHYITGEADGTRVFQEFAFNVACRLVPAWN